jgi:cell division control protein 24
VTNSLSDSDLRAEQQREELAICVNALLESNRNLSRRLMNLEDTFGARSILTKRQSIISTSDPIDLKASQAQPPSSVGTTAELSSNISKSPIGEGMDMTSSFDFETDLELSRVYRQAQRDNMDFSFRISVAENNAWSIFSGLSLGQISTIAVIALPVYPEDIANPQHYGFGKQQNQQKPVKSSSPQDQSIFHECFEIELQLSQIVEISDILQAQEMHWRKTVSLDERTDLDPLSLLRRTFSLGYH